MTEEKKIEQMLKAFYNGETTPEDEALLLKFFKRKDLEEKWHNDRDLFIVLYDSSEITLPEGINERLERFLDKHIEQTFSIEKEIRLKKIPFYSKKRRLYIAVASSAAAILLCVSIFFVSDSSSSPDMIADTYTNPQEAAIAAEQALMLVSSKLNKGLSPLEKVKVSVDKTNEVLNENFK